MGGRTSKGKRGGQDKRRTVKYIFALNGTEIGGKEEEDVLLIGNKTNKGKRGGLGKRRTVKYIFTLRTGLK